MLTDRQIKNLILEKKILIEPYDEKNCRAGKYDIHLGQYLLVPSNPGQLIDPAQPTIQPTYQRIDLLEEPYILAPGQFVLGQTHERIGLHTTIGMLIDGSSTVARLGMTIHQTSTFIPPGQDPHIITLEIANVGPWPLKLTHRLRIGKVVIFEFSQENEVSSKSFNRYNGQQHTTGAILTENNAD